MITKGLDRGRLFRRISNAPGRERAYVKYYLPVSNQQVVMLQATEMLLNTANKKIDDDSRRYSESQTL